MAHIGWLVIGTVPLITFICVFRKTKKMLKVKKLQIFSALFGYLFALLLAKIMTSGILLGICVLLGLGSAVFPIIGVILLGRKFLL